MSEYIEHDKHGESVGLVEKQFFTFAKPPDEMMLESGANAPNVVLLYLCRRQK